MKKRTTSLLALALAALALSGCAAGRRQISYIGPDAAKTAALEAAGLSAAEVQFSGAELGSYNGTDYYEVSFAADGARYEYAVDALSGVIIHSEAPPADPGVTTTVPDSANTASGSGNTPDPGVANAASEAPPTNPDVTNTAGDSGTSAGTAVASAEEAQTLALSHAGLYKDSAVFVRSALEWDDGRQVYDVEFCAIDGQLVREYDYAIDPATGAILDVDYDAEYYTPPAPPASTPQNSGGSGNTGGSSGSTGSITADEAKAIALAQVPGATEGNIREFETDYDDGRLEYEGTIVYNELEYEFEIDGYSATIRNWEVESIYD